MPSLRSRRWRTGIAGAAATAVSIVSLALSGTASATVTPAQNNIIIGSGSETAYSLMVSLDTLFNESPGCNLVAEESSEQAYNFSCTATNGYNGLPAADGENPTNDVAIQEPPLGGSAGLVQLENQGTGTKDVAPIDYATGPRTPLPTDPPGLNFVTYALDGISWFHWTEVKGVATPSAKITNLTTTQLLDIWSGTDTNWDQVGGKNAPIDVYVVNSGSGLLKLWDNYLGGSSYDAQSYVLSKGTKYSESHIIEQNEDASIIANGDEKDAIFFFSYGKYLQSCAVVCGGTKVPGTTKKKPSTTALGNINGVKLDDANILSGMWTYLVYLTNTYSNGSSSAIPAANGATLNFMSEDGFLCKPQVTASGAKIIDPNTGVWYHTEIDDLIKAAGFVPLPLGKEGDASIDHPAVVPAPYAQYDSSGSNPSGYCRVTTTDGNS